MERLFLRSPAFYADQGIGLTTRRPATAIDRDRAKTVIVDGDTARLRPTRAHHRLGPAHGCPRRSAAISSGSSPCGHWPTSTRWSRRLQPGATRWSSAAATSGSRRRRWPAKTGLDVTLIEIAPRILQRVAARRDLGLLPRRCTRRMASTCSKAPVSTGSSGEGTRHAARAGGRPRLAVDVVLVGIGIAPRHGAGRSRRARASTTASGSTNTGRTSDPAIWAAGDCASFPHAEAAASGWKASRTPSTRPNASPENMLGTGTGLHAEAVVLVGPVRRQAADRRAEHRATTASSPGPARARGACRSGTIRGDRLLSVDAMNDPRAYMVGKRLIEAGDSPDDRGWSPTRGTDLKALLPQADADRRRAAARPRSCRRRQGRRAGASAPDLRPGAREPVQRALERPTATPNPAFGCSICSPGTGALGLEALSRGAGFVTFVDERTGGAGAYPRQHRRTRARDETGSSPPRSGAHRPVPRCPRRDWSFSTRPMARGSAPLPSPPHCRRLDRPRRARDLGGGRPASRRCSRDSPRSGRAAMATPASPS